MEKEESHTGSDCFMQKWLFCLNPPLDAVRLASGQARYRRMENRLGPLQLKVNPGSEGLAGRSTWSQDAARHDPSQRVPSCDKESGLYGLTPTDSRQVFCIFTKLYFGSDRRVGPQSLTLKRRMR